MPDIVRKTAPFYLEVVDVCLRIVCSDGTHPEVQMTDTAYVLPGRTCWLTTASGEFKFWVGINGPRLFFIAWMADITPERAKDVFQFCFGGAEKVGWQVNYEPLDGGGVSVWANCMTDPDKPLTAPSDSAGFTTAQSNYTLTDDGLFWVTDIAMMVQSWIRTSERHAIKCHPKEPAPL